MYGHHVRIGWTFLKFGRTMSDDRLLFPVLTYRVSEKKADLVGKVRQAWANLQMVKIFSIAQEPH